MLFIVAPYHIRASLYDEHPFITWLRFGTDATRNAVHGSDSAENATREIDFFFGTFKRVEAAPF